jgi:hypothetical protein
MTTNRGLDPRISLATALHAQDGVYAFLLGSGVSTGAGIETGWGVVKTLTRRAAAAAKAEVDEPFDAEAWWGEHGDGKPLGYSGLLEQLASTPAARRQLLAGFFEASDDDREAGKKVPGPAHQAIAELVRRGSVRVIVTTNFDRLIEQALTDAGVQYQVVSSAAGIAGMEPLPHAGCTVVKLHGDYAQLDQLNTVEELSAYAPEMGELLARILDEYGLIINGWSADWDHALVEAIQGTRSRRYPLYWTSRSAPGPAANGLIARHRAIKIERASADEFFPDIVSRLEALDSLRAPQLTKAMAIAQLKRWLPDPLQHIRVHDLLMDETDRIAAVLRERSLDPSGLIDGAFHEREHDRLRDETDLLLHLLVTGIYYDRDGTHSDLWVQVLQRLLNAKKSPNGGFNEKWWNLEHYPALLVMYSGVATSVAVGREDVAVRLLAEPHYSSPGYGEGEREACHALHPARVLSEGWINDFPRWGSTKWRNPQSHLIRDVLPSFLDRLSFSDAEMKLLLSRVEYRVALAQQILHNEQVYNYNPASGEYLMNANFTEGNFLWENDFNTKGDSERWKTISLDLTADQARLREIVRQYGRNW